MTRREFPGGFYIDALPTGEYVVLFPGSHLETHLGRVAFPSGEPYGPLFVRCTNVREFRFAGQGHDTPHTWQWAAGVWSAHQQAVGVSPVIYDNSGVLHISDGSVGSQGYRFVDGLGRIWSGDETYYSPFAGLSEYSGYRGISIGQGHDLGGVLVFDNSGALRVLDTGECRFIRVQGRGENVAISYYKGGVGAVLVQATLTDLRALPFVDRPAPQPIPKPQPTPEPKPVNSVPDYSLSARSFIGPRLRLLGTTTATRRNSFEAVRDYAVNQRKVDPRVGLLAKTSGDNVDGFAADILAYDLGNGTCQLIDVVNDAEGENSIPTADWSLVPEDRAGIRPISQWRAPIAAPSTDGDKPAPNQSALLVDISPALAGVLARIGKLEDETKGLRATVDAQAKRIAELEARPVRSGVDLTALHDGDVVALRSHTDGRGYLTGEPDGRVEASDPDRPFGAFQLFTVEKQ